MAKDSVKGLQCLEVGRGEIWSRGRRGEDTLAEQRKAFDIDPAFFEEYM
jgi:hypothetical protein